VWTFGGSGWTLLWSIDNSAVTNDVHIGDADGNPSTLELVFTGVAHSSGSGGTGNPLYIEVFVWAGTEATSSWRFSSDFGEAWSSDLG